MSGLAANEGNSVSEDNWTFTIFKYTLFKYTAPYSSQR